jgi:hypothetical protein
VSITHTTPKASLIASEEIQTQIEEFEKSGGKITVIPTGIGLQNGAGTCWTAQNQQLREDKEK